MNVVVQHIQTKLYLGRDASWLKGHEQALSFPNALEAISFCIQRGIRSIRLVGNAGSTQESFLYPFGDDPVIKAQKKKLRRALAESRRLKAQKNMLMQRLDVLQAESKEVKKQFPMQRKPISED